MQNFISIPQPCQENWAAMTPHEQGRHCAKCNIEVKDFMNFSNEQILDYLKVNTGEIVCATLNEKQLWNQPMLSEKARAFLYAFALCFLSFLPLGILAQTNSTGHVQTGTTKIPYYNQILLWGHLTNSDNEIIPNATIEIFSDNVSVFRTVTNEVGQYSLPMRLIQKGNIITIDAIGYQTQRFSLARYNEGLPPSDELLHLVLQRLTTGLIGIKYIEQSNNPDPATPGKNELSDEEIHRMPR